MQELNSKLKKYFEITQKALDKVEINKKLDEKHRTKASEILDLSKRYYADAKHFEEKGDLVNAFAAVCYAHAFLDTGALMGLFDVDDNQLFMVD